MNQQFKELNSELSTQNFTKVLKESEFQFNAPHWYKIVNAKCGESMCNIHFQEGPVKEVGINGIFHEDLINIVVDRLKHFQDSAFACEDNEKALKCFEEGLNHLRNRTKDRKNRGVQGTYKL